VSVLGGVPFRALLTSTDSTASRPGRGRRVGAYLAVASVLGSTALGSVPAVSDGNGQWPSWAVGFAFASWLTLLAVYPDGRVQPRWGVVPYGVLLTAIGAQVVRGGDFSGGPWPALLTTGLVLGIAAQVWRYVRRSGVAERDAVRWLLVGAVPALTFLLGLTLVVATTTVTDAVYLAPQVQLASERGVLAGARCRGAGAADADAPGLRSRPARRDHGQASSASCWSRRTCSRFRSSAPAGRPRWSWRCSCRSCPSPCPPPLSWCTGGTPVRRSPGWALSWRGPSPRTTSQARWRRSCGRRSTCRTAQSSCPRRAPRRPAPHPVDARLERFPVVYDTRVVAEILVAVRPGDRALSPRDRDVVGRLALRAGGALHGAAVVAELRAAREDLVLAREEERRRLRRDLHDDLAPTLAGLGMRAAAVAALAGADLERAATVAASLESGLRDAAEQVRQIAYDLRPPLLDDRGLADAVRERVQHGVPDDGLVVDVDAQELGPLPAAVELAALRIVTESVSNVRRHAQAHRCAVSLRRQHDHLRVEVRDDGRGFDTRRSSGIGLSSITERAAELGGRADIASSPSGTTVRVWLPVGAER
jgi:signal transduction histidine kinase